MVNMQSVAFVLLILGTVSALDVVSETKRMSSRLLHANRDFVFEPVPFQWQSETKHSIQFGRILKKKNVPDCSWNSKTETCVISEEKEIEVFEKSKNSDAEYFAFHFFCDNHHNYNDCYEAGCLWEAGRCHSVYSYHEISSCYHNVSLFLHQIHHGDVCNAITNAFDCEDMVACNWDDEIGYCDVDTWYILTSVPSENGAPEGSFDVFIHQRGSTLEAFYDDFPNHKAIQKGLKKVLTWQPPTFDCPEEYNPVVCDFVLPLLRIIPVGIYCNVKYGRDWDACDADSYCEVDHGRVQFCTVSVEYLVELLYEASQSYTEAIHDPFAREAYGKSLNCSLLEDNASCESDGCEWSEEAGCEISNAELRELFLEELDDDSHPICHIYVIADRFSCGDLSTPTRCEFDEHCYWSPSDAYCFISEEAIIDYILENDSSLKQTFDYVESQCEALKTRYDCLEK